MSAEIHAAAARAQLALAAFLERKHAGFAADRVLHAEARRLSEGYTEGGSVAPDAAAGVAYLAHFGPRAIAALAAALARAPDILALPTALSRVVDLGAGSGAAALLLRELGARQLTLVDRSAAALRVARELLGTGVETSVSDVLTYRAGGATLVTSTFTLGELEGDPVEVGNRVLANIPPTAPVVVVDAGDHARARRLQQWREALLDGTRPIVGPCPHAGACPALARATDWCHLRAPKNLPQPLALFARGVGRDATDMAFAMLALGAAGAAQVPHARTLLVLGAPQKQKGRVVVPVCAPDGVRLLQALKRHRDAHDRLAALAHGTRLLHAPLPSAVDSTVHIPEPGAVVEDA